MSRRRGRAGGAPTVTVISWKGIPAQVTATAGAITDRVELPPRFQQAIDALAMREGLAGTDAYLQHWHRERRPLRTDGAADLAASAAAEAAAIDARFTPDLLAAVVAGRATADPTAPTAPTPQDPHR